MELIGVVILIISGIYLSFKFKFKHLNIIDAIKEMIKEHNNDEITPFQSLCISLASRIGVGSLSGIILSIYIGGIGSIFWMWIITLICSSNSMLESILSIRYRKKINDNIYEGGPFYYISIGLKNNFLAFLYSIIFIISYVGGFIPIQSNTISKIVSQIVPINPLIIGILIAILTSLIIFKGVKEIANIVSRLVPFISIVYILTCLYIVISNIKLIDDIFILIIKEAFNPNSFITGFTIGCTKSIFSTEAGLGTSAIASASTASINEKNQGLIQVLGINFDTFVVSTLTAFVVILTPYTSLNLTNINGIEITRYAFIYHLGKYGGLVLTLSIILFAFSTIIGGYYYGETAFKYITKKNNTLILKIITIIFIILSTIISANIIWKVIDKFIVFLAILNTISLLLLRKDVFK